jgi:molybdopterin/thiamine biosynthesis adenylyltransferase
LYPKVDEREGSKSCSDSGVLGPVPGLIGVLQSVEVIKVLTGIG